MKRTITILSPLIVLVVLIYILVELKHVKKLGAEEKVVIDRFKKEQISGAQSHVGRVFSKEEYNIISTALDRLHEDANYKVFGRKWGTRLEDPKDEFKKARDTIIKKIYPQKQKEFIEALKYDLDHAENHYGTRASHDILSDLSYYVFPKENQKKEPQRGNPKSLHVMKKTGNNKIV